MKIIFEKIIGILTKNLEEIEKERHCTTGFSHSDGYPPVINDKVLYDEIRPVLESLEGGYEGNASASDDLRGLFLLRPVCPCRVLRSGNRDRYPASQHQL